MRRALGVAGVLLCATALGACSDSDDSGQAKSQAKSASVVDDRYCGVLSTDLVHEVLDTESISTRGDDLDVAADGEQTCYMTAGGSAGSFVMTSIHLQAGASPETKKPPAGCSRPDVPADWGYTFACWNDGTDALDLVAYPRAEQMIEISVHAQPNTPGVERAKNAAGRLLTDADAAINAAN